jgi:hypothetical protein
MIIKFHKAKTNIEDIYQMKLKRSEGKPYWAKLIKFNLDIFIFFEDLLIVLLQ